MENQNSTPLNQYQYAGFWIRLAAAIIDGLVLVVINIVISFILTPILDPTYVKFKIGNMYNFSSPLESILSLISWAYLVILTSRYGATIGKRIAKLKVIYIETGKPPSLGRAFLREIIGKFVSGIVFLLGFIWAAFDPKKQGWHDKIASTYVVFEQKK